MKHIVLDVVTSLLIGIAAGLAVFILLTAPLLIDVPANAHCIGDRSLLTLCIL